MTYAQTFSPMTGSGYATHAASATSGWVTSRASTSCAEMFSPPRMMMSFNRSTIVRYSPS